MRLMFVILATALSYAPQSLGQVGASIAPDAQRIDPESPASAVEKDNKFVGLLIELPIYSFYLGAPDINGNAYVPNFEPRMGPQISWKGYGARMTFSLGLPSRERTRRGTSDQTNVLLNFYWRQYAINVYYQNFKGFYVASPYEELSGSKPDRYTQLPDAQSSHFGFNTYLSLNPGTFHFDSAFDENTASLKSGSDWIVAPFYRHWSISLGDEVIPGSSENSLQELPELSGGIFDTLGASFGYTRTWIYKETFLSILGTLGPGVQYQRFTDDFVDASKFAMAGKLNGKFAAGFKSKSYLFGTRLILDTLYARVRGTDVYSSMAGMEFYVNRAF